MKEFWKISHFIVLESQRLETDCGTFLSLVHRWYFIRERNSSGIRKLLKAGVFLFTLAKCSRILQRFLLKLKSYAKILDLSDLPKVGGGNSSFILFWTASLRVSGCSKRKMFFPFYKCILNLLNLLNYFATSICKYVIQVVISTGVVEFFTIRKSDRSDRNKMQF